MKLDIIKAYDKVSWEILEFVPRKFWFSEQIIRIIIRCVTPYISILINGEASQFFQPSRDLRQSDPLTPLLLIIYMAGLSELINKFNQHGVWLGVPFWESGSEITHMLFVDDVMLFAEASPTNIQNVRV